MSKPFYRGYWALAFGLLLCCVYCGCGAGAYEKRLDARVQEIREGATANLNVVELAGTGLSVYLPKEMKDGGQAKPPLAIFDGPNLPTWKVTYEGFSVPDANGGQQPYYCYVGVADPGTANAAALAQAIQQQLQQKYPDTPCNTSDVTCLTPEGQNVTCKKLRFNVPQEFIYKGKNTPMPGTIEIYVRDVGGSAAAIVWHLPTTMEESIELPKVGPQVAGSVGAKGG
jgi:hypothetical protein